MNEVMLLANLLFSETKNIDDAKGIANVVINRMKRPERFGNNLQEVVLAPYQFSGVGSREWQKAESRKFSNDDEANIYKQMLAISNSALRGNLEDVTNGADHYVNLKLARPKWARVYSKTNKIGEHTYFSELPKKNISKEISFSDAFASAKSKGKNEFVWKGNRYNTQTK